MTTVGKKFQPLKDINGNNFSAGIVSSLIAITGPPAIILAAAVAGGYTTEQTIYWMFAVYFFGGLYSIVMPLIYKIPISGAHSITGVAFIATVTSQFTFHELVGAYIISGIFMTIVGALRIFSKLMDMVPKEIISAMLAGMITQYIVNFVLSATEIPIVAIGSILTYFVCIKWGRNIPPVVAAIFVGAILLLLTESISFGGNELPFVMPTVQVPEWNPLSILSVALPLALLVLTNDAAVGIGALEQNGYKPPVNKIVTTTGLMSIVTGLFGGQSANIGGMMSAICSDPMAGKKEKRYMAGVVSGTLVLLSGVFAWKLVPIIEVLPKSFISLLIGFGLLGVFANSMHTSFASPSRRLSSTFAFAIAFSQITIFHISAPVWSLLIGTLIAKFVEDNRVSKKKNKQSA